MLSKEVLRVKRAPNMGLMEAVRHCLFLLSEENLEFVKGRKSKGHDEIELRIQRFSTEIEDSLSAYNSERIATSMQTASAAATMFQQGNVFSDVKAIDKMERRIMTAKAKQCLAWAHDPARPAVPGAEHMTNDQVEDANTG